MSNDIRKMWENAAEAAALARLQRKSGVDLGLRGKAATAEGRGSAGHAVTGQGDAAIKRRVDQAREVAKKFDNK